MNNCIQLYDKKFEFANVDEWFKVFVLFDVHDEMKTNNNRQVTSHHAFSSRSVEIIRNLYLQLENHEFNFGALCLLMTEKTDAA